MYKRDDNFYREVIGRGKCNKLDIGAIVDYQSNLWEEMSYMKLVDKYWIQISEEDYNFLYDIVIRFVDQDKLNSGQLCAIFNILPYNIISDGILLGLSNRGVRDKIYNFLKEMFDEQNIGDN